MWIIAKSSASGYWLAFACIGVAYESVAYKKSMYSVKLKLHETTPFYKQLGSGLSPQSCIYFKIFGLKLNGLLLV